MKRSPVPQRPDHRLRQRIERAADVYLEDCYARRIRATAGEFAQHLERSREHLTRSVARVTGMPLREFLRKRQLVRAERLLRTTSLSAVQIATACAFGTRTAFYRAFKAAFDMTPGDYRRKITK